MDTAGKATPSQPLRPLSRYPKPAAWGFVLDDDCIAACLKKKADAMASGTEDIDTESPEYMQLCQDFYAELTDKCNKITHDEPLARHRLIRVKGNPLEEIAIVFTWHTRPDDKLIPSPDKVEELKKMLATYGFDGEPGWHIGLNN
ncbi:hypothetical protein CPB84DRAFT_1826219 [Gymnopilus junonius]|uniref:Uncharacterized protein n=1 Tax=Gymnopilus junonius TaxID=109634 RepID=A0A9P5NKW6_GYMJU|nr:hypothetical protein CPB84DRAFT_1826219 [Gymnopilus junonius]